MLIAGIVLLAIAAGLFFWGRSTAARRDALAAVTTSRCGDLAGAPDGPCEVVGAAAPGPNGLLKAPLSGEECVWHNSVVTEHYWDWEYRTVNGERRRERERKTRTVSSQASSIPFAVRDDSGTVLVDPTEARVDEARSVWDHFEDSGAGVGVRFSIGPFDLTSGDDTIGYQQREWALLPGDRLFVHGAISGASGTATIGKGTGHLVISTRSEEEVQRSAARTTTAILAGAGVTGLIGLGLLVAGLLA